MEEAVLYGGEQLPLAGGQMDRTIAEVIGPFYRVVSYRVVSCCQLLPYTCTN